MKVLVIRFSSIGDIILTTPIVRCLHSQLPSEVHYLTKPGFSQLVDPNPHIAKTIRLQSSIANTAALLREEKYDFIIDLHHNLRSWIIKRRLGIRSAAFYKANLEKWLMTTWKWNRLPQQHIVDRYFGATAELKINYDGAGLDFFFPSDFQPPDTPQSKFFVFAIGGAHATKRLPTDKIVDICKLLEAPVYLLGGKEDEQVGESIARQVTHVTNLCGQGSIADSAYWTQQAAAVLTHDTGMMHIAAALRRPIVSIWGNTIPAFGMYPFYPDGFSGRSSIFEVDSISCRPCSKIGFNTCPKGHFRCMQSQDIQAIASFSNQIISDNEAN